jgi:hypothetical protein
MADPLKLFICFHINLVFITFYPNHLLKILNNVRNLTKNCRFFRLIGDFTLSFRFLFRLLLLDYYIYIKKKLISLN